MCVVNVSVVTVVVVVVVLCVGADVGAAECCDKKMPLAQPPEQQTCILDACRRVMSALKKVHG